MIANSHVSTFENNWFGSNVANAECNECIRQDRRLVQSASEKYRGLFFMRRGVLRDFPQINK